MFTTFYSYKGGVGRSLALANVAWLLANHKTEPVRVLAIDFDLNAPGLHRVFGLKGEGGLSGLVDFVHKFISEAEIDDIQNYIHATKFPNIDILPAGSFSKGYQERLEAINWGDFYENAHGFELIRLLKQMINEIVPAYDYVLVDSLTGYSDVGGICVRQIADSVVLLFRLNNQNLDGIGSVYQSLQKGSTESSIPVIPVITPAWPFIDSEATDWYAKAKAVFPKERLSQISFDGGLSFGESIVSQDHSRDLRPRVLSDYEDLALRVRSKNVDDPLTMWNMLREEGPALLPDSLDRYQRLLTLRPNSDDYWQFLPNVVFSFRPFAMSGSGFGAASPLRSFVSFVDGQCDAGNKHALLARARFESFWNPKLKKPRIEDLDRALTVDPKFLDALIARGQMFLLEHDTQRAIVDFTSALQQLPERDSRRGGVNEQLGAAYLDILDGQNSVLHYTDAIKFDSRDPDLYAGLSRALYLVGNYERALRAVNDLRSLVPDDEITVRLLPIQIRAAMGEVEESKAELAQILSSSRENKTELVNIAEAYLSVQPEMTLEILEKSSLGHSSSPVESLRVLAKVFLGSKKSLATKDIAAITKEGKNKKIVWSTFEIFAMLRWGRASGRLTDAQVDLAEQTLSILGPMLPAIRATRRR